MVCGFQLHEVKLEKLETLSFPALPMRRSSKHFALYHHVITRELNFTATKCWWRKPLKLAFWCLKGLKAVGCVCLRVCYLYSCEHTWGVTTPSSSPAVRVSLLGLGCYKEMKSIDLLFLMEHWFVSVLEKNAIWNRCQRKCFNNLQWKVMCILCLISAALYWRLCGETGRGNSQTTINQPRLMIHWATFWAMLLGNFVNGQPGELSR